MEKMESKPVTAAKATSGDSSSPVKIVDGNSSQQKMENTPMNTDEATRDDSLSPVVIVDGNSPQHMPKRKRECKPVAVAEATSGDFLLEEATPKVRGMPPSSRAKNRREYFRVKNGPNAVAGRMISRDYVPGHSVVIIRLRASVVETNTTEDDEEIFEEEAVCKFCFQVVEGNVSKTNCSCKTALVHDECAANKIRVEGNNKCGVCDQDVPHLPVTLIRGQGPIAARDNVHESKKKGFFSLLKRAF